VDNPFEAPADASSSADAGALDLADFTPAPHLARFFANLIDSILVAVVFMGLVMGVGIVIGLVIEASGGALGDGEGIEDALTVPLFLLLGALYVIVGLIEGSSWQASPGKRLLGLRVVHASGRDIKLAEGVGRQLLKIFVLNLCGLAGLVCLEEPARRGPWDFILSTRVVAQNRWNGGLDLGCGARAGGVFDARRRGATGWVGDRFPRRGLSWHCAIAQLYTNEVVGERIAGSGPALSRPGGLFSRENKGEHTNRRRSCPTWGGSGS